MIKKSIRKMIITSCAAAMMVGVLTACGSDDRSDDNKAEVTIEEKTSEDESSEIEKNKSGTESSETEADKSGTESSETEENKSGVEDKKEAENDNRADVSASDTNNDLAEKSYTIATLAADADVESFATDVIDTIKAKDVEKLADILRYPVSVNGNDVADKDTFLSLVNEKGISDTYVNSVSALSNKDLFANGQGICLGSGEVWFRDVNFDGISENGDPDFKIITLNGILSE